MSSSKKVSAKKKEFPQWKLSLQCQPSLDNNPNADPTLPICHFLPVSDSQALLKSCSNEFRNNPSLKSKVKLEAKFFWRILHSTHVWVAEWNRHLTSNTFMVGVVIETFYYHQCQFCQRCQICDENENLECYTTKPSCVTATGVTPVTS